MVWRQRYFRQAPWTVMRFQSRSNQNQWILSLQMCRMDNIHTGGILNQLDNLIQWAQCLMHCWEYSLPPALWLSLQISSKRQYTNDFSASNISGPGNDGW